VRGALERIARNLARFAARCLAAGADGIFLSVRDDWLALDEAGPRRSEPDTRSGSREEQTAGADETDEAGDSACWAHLVDVETPGRRCAAMRSWSSRRTSRF